jgi:hypothetical protein
MSEAIVRNIEGTHHTAQIMFDAGQGGDATAAMTIQPPVSYREKVLESFTDTGARFVDEYIHNGEHVPIYVKELTRSTFGTLFAVDIAHHVAKEMNDETQADAHAWVAGQLVKLADASADLQQQYGQ